MDYTSYQIELFEYLNINSFLLECTFLQFDLLPDRHKNEYNKYLYTLLDTDVFIFTYSGYDANIRENRYVVILVDEFTKIKRDLNLYNLLDK